MKQVAQRPFLSEPAEIVHSGVEHGIPSSEGLQAAADDAVLLQHGDTVTRFRKYGTCEQTAHASADNAHRLPVLVQFAVHRLQTLGHHPRAGAEERLRSGYAGQNLQADIMSLRTETSLGKHLVHPFYMQRKDVQTEIPCDGERACLECADAAVPRPCAFGEYQQMVSGFHIRL